jgi:GMP synthase-like glutamine amidotransferase
MRVLAVTHGPRVGPELFGDVLAEDGHELVEWPIEVRGAPPPSGWDAILIFGGDQNVGEEVEHPWLHDEYDALRAWVETETPLFAVCLGAQTLAFALGGSVTRIEPTQLAGFYGSELTDDGAADSVLGVLPRRFDALNANGYEFTVPPGAVPLAAAPFAQAFRAGERAWAVQFHPEVRRDQVLGWFADDEPTLPRPLPELKRELDAKLPSWQEHGRRLCRAFLAAAVVAVALLAAGCGGTRTVVKTVVRTPPPSATGDQRVYGQIRSVTPHGDGYLLRIDPAWFLTGITANVAQAEDEHVKCAPSSCPPVANDVHVVDETHRPYTYILPAATRGTVLVTSSGRRTITAGQLADLVAHRSALKLFEPLQSGVWLLVHIDTVRTFAQQYVP